MAAALLGAPALHHLLDRAAQAPPGLSVPAPAGADPAPPPPAP
ncbi:hypothetical protein AB0K43_26655 [Kitasatospora sp. NPDC049258]